MTKEYIKTRKPFEPEEREEYENEGGGTFRCVRSYGTDAVMRNTRSGWEFIAHGIGIYEDGRIDWDYSTYGSFCER